MSQRGLCAQPAQRSPSLLISSTDSSAQRREKGGGRREDSDLCATASKRERSSGRSGRERREKEGRLPGGEWKKSGSSQSSRTGELFSCTALVIQEDAAELPAVASQSLWVEAAIQT